MHQERPRICCAIVAIALLVSFATVSKAALITNGGFETPETVSGGFPTSFGDWAGDSSTIVTTENGIVPLEGSRMLRFDGTASGGAGGTGSDIFQLVDMSSFGALIATGQAQASLTAHYDRVAGDAQTDTEFNIILRSYNGLPVNFPTDFGGPNELSFAAATISTDSDTNTWELASLTVPVPIGTDYLAIGIRAAENVFNDLGAPEFDGHYADNVALSIGSVPEPSSIALLSLGGLTLLGYGWRRKSKTKLPA